ncbi:hypothetical protein bcgnr5400_26410 [Bacillus luti]
MVCYRIEIKLEFIKVAGLGKVDTERSFLYNYFVQERERGI